MLRCDLPNMAVRPQDGIAGLREGVSLLISTRYFRVYF